ncbi:eukaryotic mitochondrial regulator protein-domain-containing protein [Boletus edulis]|nr:eukaryotic mitochondrial regulator protein-domain-containing protein [Boletus edulis]
MIPRLYHASSRLFVSTRVHHDARLTFSSSAISFVRRPPQRSAGERANLAAENETNTDESKEDEELDRWLLAGEKKVNETGIRSYKNPYEHFIKNVAPSFREPSPRNWLGRDVPFPLNPSFKPPIPLSDELRTRLYRAYMIDPKLNSVRALAARHNISIKRVDAILRLKGMEESWKKEVSIFVKSLSLAWYCTMIHTHHSRILRTCGALHRYKMWLELFDPIGTRLTIC